MAFTRAFVREFRGERASPVQAFFTSVGVGGAVGAAVYRLLRR
ncbi:MAG: hypothetical protein ACJ766_06080 [Thermoleophilaceae bacterium]